MKQKILPEDFCAFLSFFLCDSIGLVLFDRFYSRKMEYEKKYAPFFVNKICPKKSTNPILLLVSPRLSFEGGN